MIIMKQNKMTTNVRVASSVQFIIFFSLGNYVHNSVTNKMHTRFPFFFRNFYLSKFRFILPNVNFIYKGCGVQVLPKKVSCSSINSNDYLL